MTAWQAEPCFTSPRCSPAGLFVRFEEEETGLGATQQQGLPERNSKTWVLLETVSSFPTGQTHKNWEETSLGLLLLRAFASLFPHLARPPRALGP